MTGRGWQGEQGAGRGPCLLHCARSSGPALQFLSWNGLVQRAGAVLIRPAVRAQRKLFHAMRAGVGLSLFCPLLPDQNLQQSLAHRGTRQYLLNRGMKEGVMNKFICD